MASRETSHLGEFPNLGNSPAVSVILTVVNESRHLADAVKAVLRSDYGGEIEIIIAVGPSRDGTRNVAESIAREESRVRVIDNPSGRTPDGLNAALAQCRNDVMVRIDGHCEIDARYIAQAVEILNLTGAVNVGGLMAAEGTTRFERAVANPSFHACPASRRYPICRSLENVRRSGQSEIKQARRRSPCGLSVAPC